MQITTSAFFRLPQAWPNKDAVNISSGWPPSAISSCPPEKFVAMGTLPSNLAVTPSNYRAMHSTLRRVQVAAGGRVSAEDGIAGCRLAATIARYWVLDAGRVRMSSRVRSNWHGRHTCRSSELRTAERGATHAQIGASCSVCGACRIP